MISVDVISEEKKWNKKIKKKNIFFNSLLKLFPRKYRFVGKKVSLTILLSNNKNIKKLNKKFRNKNKATDILSFPSEKKLNISNKISLEGLKILYKDEVMYAIGNIIQNSIFHSKNVVNAEIKMPKSDLILKISDDGDGFPRDILDKLGEPYVSKSKKGMGLGIFIAKNLIENMNGKILFYNSNQGHAVVEITFNKSILAIWIKH